MKSRIGPLTYLIVPLFVLVACSSAIPVAPAPAVSPTSAAGQSPTVGVGQTAQTSEGGQVTVVAKWDGPPAGAVFDLTLDTHSVNLDGLDLADAVLRNNRQETLSAKRWSAPMGGHHRAGALSFEGDAASFFAGARWVELVLSGVGDIPKRALRWEIGG
ncbi:MAG: hypothetical protein ABI725_00920 [Chloroflexota bacterium]